ncbi:MAG TPA: hypothetical protein VK186_02540 [Candidatus Deferrimicrobium sp.]|nr:hypothetical protein [Candidatus Deferrimicrobium sp.]
MYTKKEILDEMKRVAEKLGVKTLKREDFEQNTTIPNDTLRYYLSSWDQALKDAGMTPGKEVESKGKREPQSDDELLSELVRIYDETGETPTAALINSMGRYEYRHYASRWKSLDEALNLAFKRFPAKSRTDSASKSDSGDFDKRLFSSLSDFSELGIYQDDMGETSGKTGESDIGPSIVEVPFATDVLRGHKEEVKEEQLFPDKEIVEIIAPPPTIKLIPKTIKPTIVKKKPKTVGESIEFRGLKFAPVDARGVAYLFGMISRELGFVIETFRTVPPNIEGKRCTDTASDRWEKVKIDFVYKSSDFNTPGHNEMETDIIICWLHDWKDCPVEILELRSIIQLLDASSSF